MKFVVYAFVILSLAGCQTILGPGLPSGLQPIEEPVTLGNVSVVNATVHQRESIVGYKQGQSGSITIDSEILVDVQRAGRCFYLRTEVLSVQSRFANIIETWAEIYRMQFAAREGRVISYEADLDTAEVSARLAREGAASPGQAANALVYNILLEQLHFGGETVAQGEELLRYRLGDQVAGLEKAQADLVYSLRAVGRAVVAGRPVIVAQAQGHIWAEDAPIAIDAVMYFDERSGVAVHSDTTLRHLSGEEADTRIRIVRDLNLEEPRPDGNGTTAPARSPAAPGKCQVET